MCGASLHDNCGLPLLGDSSTGPPRPVIWPRCVCLPRRTRDKAALMRPSDLAPICVGLCQRSEPSLRSHPLLAFAVVVAPAARQQLRAQLRAAAMTSQERFSVHSQLEHLQAKYVGTGHADTTKLCAPQTADRMRPFVCALPPVLTVAVDHWWQ